MKINIGYIVALVCTLIVIGLLWYIVAGLLWILFGLPWLVCKCISFALWVGVEVWALKYLKV